MEGRRRGGGERRDIDVRIREERDIEVRIREERGRKRDEDSNANKPLQPAS